MTAVASNAHTVQIVAASSSSLATRVATMSVNTWQDWAGGFLPASICNPAGLDPVTSNGIKFAWDKINEEVCYYGHGHNGRQSLMLNFSDSSNAWRNTDGVPIAAGLSDMHQFSLQTHDPARGKIFFHEPYGNGSSFRLYYRPAATKAWSLVSGDDPQGGHAQLPGMAFNPTVGTQGVVLSGSTYGITQWDVAANSWSTRWPGFGSGGIQVADFSNGFYDIASTSSYMCGGNNFGALALVQIPATGSVVNKNNLPAQVQIPTSSATGGIVVDADVSTRSDTNGLIRRPLLIVPGGGMWTYQSGGDSWTSLGITAPAAGSPSINTIFVGYVSKYDCYVMWRQTSADGSCTASVFKPPLTVF